VPPSANVWKIFETRCNGRKIPLDGGIDFVVNGLLFVEIDCTSNLIGIHQYFN
jgi:hypothetical protein